MTGQFIYTMFDLQNCFTDMTDRRQTPEQNLKFLSFTKSQHNFLSKNKLSKIPKKNVEKKLYKIKLFDT